MKTMEGLATSSTPMVRRLRCSTLSPLCPGSPTREPLSDVSSMSSITWSMMTHLCRNYETLGTLLSSVGLFGVHSHMKECMLRGKACQS